MGHFEEKEFISRLTEVFRQNGLASLLSKEKTEAFYRLAERLLEENEKYNLTAIKDRDGIIRNHFADCAMLAVRLPKGAKVIDVGCGAGFPSLPIAMLRPDISVLAIDSTAKKVRYVAESAALLGLGNLQAEVMRAEDLSAHPAWREAFDVATARAVAELRILCEFCLPYVKVGGQMIAMKGRNAASEIAAAKKAVAMLGGKISEVEEIRLLGGSEEETHPLVKIDKIAHTPANYPRPNAQIVKKPL